jgi:hypothetical protein
LLNGLLSLPPPFSTMRLDVVSYRIAITRAAWSRLQDKEGKSTL